MSTHALIPDRTRRSARTLITVTLSVVIVILGLVPVIVQAVEPLHEQLPGDWYPGLVGVAAVIVAVATAVQRILTSAPIEQLLQDKAPALAAVSPAGVATITTLGADERANLTSLAAALDEGDPGRTALERVLTT